MCMATYTGWGGLGAGEEAAPRRQEYGGMETGPRAQHPGHCSRTGSWAGSQVWASATSAAPPASAESHRPLLIRRWKGLGTSTRGSQEAGNNVKNAYISPRADMIKKNLPGTDVRMGGEEEDFPQVETRRKKTSLRAGASWSQVLHKEGTKYQHQKSPQDSARPLRFHHYPLSPQSVLVLQTRFGKDAPALTGPSCSGSCPTSVSAGGREQDLTFIHLLP